MGYVGQTITDVFPTSVSLDTVTTTNLTATNATASTSLKTPLVEFTDGDDALAIADGGYVTQTGLPFVFVNGNDANTRTLSNSHVFFNTAEASQAAASVTGSSTVTGAGNNGIAYTSGNGRFTVPVAGKYLITGRFRYAETGDEAVSVTINTNANQDVAYCILQCTEATTLIITACANLAANDYIRFVHGSGADRGFYMANGHCGASIFLIG